VKKKKRLQECVQNHDTGCAQAHWEFPRHGLEQGYCYILTHPGTPTVFYNHLYDPHKFPGVAQAIESLIAIRKRNDLGARSVVSIADFSDRHYAAIIDDKVAMRIGDDRYQPGHGWKLAASGDRWVVWERQ
jgi:alpha-amylase